MVTNVTDGLASAAVEAMGEPDSPLLEPHVIVSHTVARFENVLEPGEITLLLDVFCGASDQFVTAGVSQGDPNVRRAKVLHNVQSVAPDFSLTLEACMPLVQRLFPEVGPGWEPELQITVHEDGGFFGLHTDSASPDTARRLLTFVYYLAEEPAQFSGGELVIHDSPVNHPNVISPSCHIVYPVTNTLVFFRSSAWHEVRPVVCPSTTFRHQRFTINGWIKNSEMANSEEGQ